MSDPQPPWGALAPNPVERAVLSAAHAAPRRGLRRTLASAARGVMTTFRRGPIDVEVYGFRARLRPRSNLADKRALFYPRHWDTAERALLDAIVTPDFAFIDIGANTGLYSLFVAARAGAQARILAVEPQPEVKDWLAFNIDANDFSSIRHIDAAIAGERGIAHLTLPEKNRGTASIADSGALSIEVPTLSVLDLMNDAGIERADALKIDIEGAEDIALPPFFATCPPERLPPVIIMEQSSHRWSVDCVALARQAGYEERAVTRMNVVLTRPSSPMQDLPR